MVLRRAVSDAQVPQTPDAPLARGVGHRQSRPVTGSEIEEDLDQVRSSPPHPPPSYPSSYASPTGAQPR
jgi:hypothetical protein